MCSLCRMLQELPVWESTDPDPWCSLCAVKSAGLHREQKDFRNKPTNSFIAVVERQEEETTCRMSEGGFVVLVWSCSLEHAAATLQLLQLSRNLTSSSSDVKGNQFMHRNTRALNHFCLQITTKWIIPPTKNNNCKIAHLNGLILCSLQCVSLHCNNFYVSGWKDEL